MSRGMLLVLLCSIATVMGCAEDAPVDVPAPVPYAIDAMVDGKTYTEWAIGWHQFMMAVPIAEVPFLDTTGAHCADRQTGPVWYLAGAGSSDPVTRACTIPANTKIFLPLVNYLNDFPCPDPTFAPAAGQSLEAFLTAGASGIAVATTDVGLDVDGVAIPNVRNYRVTTNMFNFTADISNQANDSCITGMEQQGVSDGYWLMLPPLSPGAHTLHIHALQDWGGGATFAQDVTYNLTISG